MMHDDFATEPVKGLPERPPEGEDILWQGRPKTWALARDALALYWVAGYFVLLAGWRIVFGGAEGSYELSTATPYLILGALCCAILLGIAFMQARATVYIITSKRVSMRIGAALILYYNLPFTQIGNANLDLRRDGTGTIALELMGDDRLSYTMTWPHVRPWRMTRTEPALRCIPDAANVAKILADAAETRVSIPQVTRNAPADAAAVAAE
ncbi:photosynthetic complex putative assembly protein PuhB [Cognatishimia sp. MH4019]|uniref:photosynthetic complex putative assembly protein PuhB n=1 Tax=Cognatishimia sp. MH4019 TaxID=2854030 RepID=UPI001CD26AA5